jgi:hypothetical protein
MRWLQKEFAMHLFRSLIVTGLLLVPLHAFAQTGGAGRANPGVLGESLNNSNPNPSLNPNSPLPPAPGTNGAGTARPSGSSSNVGAGVTTGSAAGSTANAKIRAEDPSIDKKIKSICRGC